MNIYFACSITGGREFESIYQELTRALLADSHIIPTAHLAEPNAVSKEAGLEARRVYERDVAWILDCNVLIAEVSVPSHGVGYEIGFALENGKPVLCLYQRGRKVSKMITGNPHRNLKIDDYGSVGEAVELMGKFINSI
jgi:2'-deoxynucleoside 5'-phosphate N-hydrolase